MSTTTEYAITGMTCAHCERAVGDEIGTISGVETVEVSADRGVAVVTSAAPLEREAVRAAVDEAGYELADA